MDNLLLLSDSYKASHYKQYPPGTEQIYSYFESRGGMFPHVVFFGLQYYIKKYLEGQVVTKEKIDEAEQVWNAHFGTEQFNRAGWEYILHKHDGRLPVRIKAVPEGTVVPVKNALMTIENTDPKCFWLTNYLETLLVQVWYGSTVATQSREIKRLIKSYTDKTGGTPGLDFKLHDFGFRGVSSVESAAIGGAAHLLNFLGTDTIAACTFLRDYYNAEGMPGFSIPASEHSTMTAWGKQNEVEAFRNMLDQYPSGLVACVSDSYDIWSACYNLWGDELKDKVMGREGTLVVRPDSGYPPEIVLDCLQLLGKRFGVTVNEQGYKVLDPHVRVIQGDGVDYEMIDTILSHIKEAGWSADNVNFGMGGGLLQKLNRDTQKFAFKCSSATIHGEEVDIYKDPVTDHGKVSKRGRFSLVSRGHAHQYVLTTVTEQEKKVGEQDFLLPVFENGKLLYNDNLGAIRERAKLK